MGLVCGCQLMNGPLDVDAMRRSAENLSYGAVVTFCAEVTGAGQQTITADEERALFQMFAIAEEAVSRWDANVSIVQRLGEVIAGDVSLVVISACATQVDAFDCCRFVAENIADRVPVFTQT